MLNYRKEEIYYMATSTGSYSMSIDKIKKEMNVTILGNFTPEQALTFINEYNAKVATVTPSDYTLRLDCLDLKVVTPDLIPALEDCYTLYNQSGFSKVLFEIKNNPIVKMQLNRIMRKVGLNNAEIIEL